MSILSTYRENKDKIYELLNKNPDAVYNFKDGIIFLLLHSDNTREAYGVTKLPLDEYFDEWYNTIKDLIDYSCTSPITTQFGGKYKYTTYNFNSLIDMVDFLEELYYNNYITISYFDCVEMSSWNTVRKIKQYRIKINVNETKQKRRSLGLDDLLN